MILFTMSETPERSPLDRWVFARLDEIHSAALRWRDELSAAAADSNITQSVAVENTRMPQVKAVIDKAMEAIRTLRSSQPPGNVADPRVAEDEWIAGVAIDIELIWQKIENAWRLDATKPTEAIATMKSCAQYLDELVFICMQRRLAPEINDVLANVETGHQLDLDFVFGADFPQDAEKRKRLILEVAQERDVLDSALVDASQGVVYRLASAGQRWKSYLATPALLLAMVIILGLLPLVKHVYSDWPFDAGKRTLLIAGYLLWMVGTFVHGLIEALRQIRSSTVPAFAAIDNWSIWLQIKQKAIFMGTLWVSLGFLLVAFLWKDLNLSDWRTLLLAGYSSDSLTELFVQRFESAASKVKDQIQGATSKTDVPKTQAAAV
jgi:hypothetical protein